MVVLIFLPQPRVHNSKGVQLPCQLIPRPHPLVRRNSLVNQVKFLELVHTFATV